MLLDEIISMFFNKSNESIELTVTRGWKKSVFHQNCPIFTMYSIIYLKKQTFKHLFIDTLYAQSSYLYKQSSKGCVSSRGNMKKCV